MSNDSFKDKFINHIRSNRGKYSALGGVGATLGGLNLAGNGYLGTRAQDVVHDTLYPIAQNMKISSLENGVKAKIDPVIDVYKKSDNMFSNENNDRLLATENILQKENIPAISGDFGSKLVNNLAGLTPNEKLNYLFRNPGEGIALKFDEYKAPTKGAINAISDIIN